MTKILAKEVVAKGITTSVVARTELFLAGKDDASIREVVGGDWTPGLARSERMRREPGVAYSALWR
jgi:hypothetical protein